MKKSIFFLSMFFSLHLFADIIVVEPLGIMVHIDQSLAQSQLGFKTLMSIGWGCLTSFSLPSEEEVEVGLFNSLSQMPLPSWAPLPESDVVTHYHGREVPPPLLAHYLGYNVLAEAQAFLEPYDNNRFKTKAIHKTIKAVLPFSFDAEKQASILVLNKENLALLQSLKKAGHEIYLFSSSNLAVIHAMLEHFPELNELISGFFCAEQAEALKPMESAYDAFATEYELNLHELIQVDPERYHIAQLPAYGMRGYTNLEELPVVQELALYR